MKFKFKFIPLTFFVAINLVVIVAMNFCAYTCYLHPSVHPNWSYFGLIFPVFLLMDVCFVFFWLVFKWRFMLIPIVGMLLCARSVFTYYPVRVQSSAPEGAIKILSYNVMNFGGGTMDRDSVLRNPIYNYIKDSGADIVCTQESSVRGCPDMIGVLSEIYPYVMQGTDDDYKLNIIMSKFPVVDVEHIDYDTESNRSYAYKLLVGSDTVLVVNVHFESYRLQQEDKQEYKDIIRHPKNNSNKDKYMSLTQKLAVANAKRGRQADRVAEYVDSVPCKYKIVCGDFNDPSLSYSHHRLTRHLNDAYTEAGLGAGISYHLSGMYFRIDNILVSDNISSYGAKVDNSIGESDHYPIFSYLFLNRN